MKRFLADAFLLVSALFLPATVTLVLAFALFFVFEPFYEVLFVAVLLDALYGAPTSRFGEFQLVFSAAAFAGYFAALFLKRRMRLNDMLPS